MLPLPDSCVNTCRAGKRLSISVCLDILTSKINEGTKEMAEIATTKMSSKGQVVIPEDIRKRLGLEPGSQFVVIGEDDTVILKSIAAPEMNEFDELIARARSQARKAGMKQSDIASAVEKIRSRS